MVTVFLQIADGNRKAGSPYFADLRLRPQPKNWIRGAGQNYPSAGGEECSDSSQKTVL